MDAMSSSQSKDQNTAAKVRAAGSVPAKLVAAAGPMGLVAMVLFAASLVVAAGPVYRTLRAAMTPSPEAVSGKIDAKEQAEAYAGGFDGFVAQTSGRSLFYVPSAPGTEQVVVIEPEVSDGNGAPRAPSKYDGPAIQAIVLDEVWFADGTKIGKGKSKGDTEILEVNAPWDAKVKWKGGEFTVALFARDKIVFKDGVKVNATQNEDDAPTDEEADKAAMGDDEAAEVKTADTKDADKPAEKEEVKPEEKPKEEKPDEKPASPPAGP